MGQHLELIVTRVGSAQQGVQLEYTLNGESLGLVPCGRVPLEVDPVRYFQVYLHELGGSRHGARRREALEIGLRAAGAALFQRLLPEPLREKLWELREEADSLEVISDELSIPWELLRFAGRRSDRFAEGLFFAEQFEITRWVPGISRVHSLPLQRMAVVVGDRKNLDAAGDERRQLGELAAAAASRGIEDIASHLPSLVARMARGEHDGWHFIGHGAAAGPDPDFWRFQLADGSSLSPRHLSGEARALGRLEPLVFLNACETGLGGLTLTGAGGWATAFIQAGAGAFVGSLWEVPDDAARAFAIVFYREFLSGRPIGSAMHRAREVVREEHGEHPTWLAYVLYAHRKAACRGGGAVAATAAEPAPSPPSPQLARLAALMAAQARAGRRASGRTTAPPGPIGDTSPPRRPTTRSQPSRPPTPRPGEERLHEPDGSVLLYVPGGEYPMGAEDINDWTRPVHRVRLAPFWIARHPVTNEQYARFLASHPGAMPPEFWQDERFNAPQQPVVGVSWEDAEAYCRWVGLALPSEAQWEAAARGPEGWRYPWGDKPAPEPRHANFGGRLGATSPVDAHPDGRGPFGTLDQAGNVWEWCADSWSLTAYRQRGEGAWNPVTRGDTSMRVLRGGSWVNPGRDLRAAYRDRATARLRFNTQGFRCVLPIEPA